MIPQKLKESLKLARGRLRPEYAGIRPSHVGRSTDHATSGVSRLSRFAPPVIGRGNHGDSQRLMDPEPVVERKPLPRVGSAVLVVDGDQLLLGVRGKEPNSGKWVLPGGRVNPFETLADAGRRELLEETGLDIRVDDQVHVLEIIDPPGEHRLIVFSQGRPVGGSIVAGSDLLDARFCTRDEIQTLDLSDVIRPVLEKLGWA